MKILVAHNSYKQFGGEDVVFQREVELLRKHGHAVIVFSGSNSSIETVGAKVVAAIGCIFSISTYFSVRRLLRQVRPEVVHVHNPFPKFSPAIFYACRAEGVPVVFTLHNYRTICPTALLMHRGRVIESSIEGGPWWAVWVRAYRGSFLGTLAVALMISIHRSIGTWTRTVDRYIVLTEFSRRIFLRAGFPEEKLVVKANFVDAPSVNREPSQSHFLFAGRLSEEKGVKILLNVDLPRGARIRVAGEGPLADSLRGERGFELLGALSREQVSKELSGAIALIVPSIWFEGLPMVVLEAFSLGVPVIASRIGSLEELVEHGRNGLLFESGNSADLGDKIRWALSNRDRMMGMGLNARSDYLARYSPEICYSSLIKIYEEVVNPEGC